MMGNYSLLDTISPVEITPLGQDIMRDPRAASRMATDLSGMSAYKAQEPGVLLGAEPGGVVTGQPGSTFYSATPEDDSNVVMKAIGTVLGAPFNILRGAKEGLEEAIGHPYAMQRQAQDEQYAMLASTLSDTDKTAVGMPVDRSGVNARQTSGSTVATGMSYGISPTLTPRKTGIVEMITGETRKQRALEMARLQAALKAQGVNLNIEALKTGIYKDAMAGRSSEASAINSLASADKTGVETGYLRKYGDADWRAKIDAQVANAQQSRAGAFNQTQQGLTAQGTRPGLVQEANARGLDAERAAQRNEELFRKVTLPGGLDTNDRNSREFWDVKYPAGLTANDQSKQAFSLAQGMREDERRQKEAESDANVKKTISDIGNDALRTAAGVDYLNTRSNLTNAQAVTEGFKQEKLDAQTSTIVNLAAASIDKISAQIEGIADTSRLTQARTRLEDIRGGVLLNRDERDNAMGEVRRALLETRMDLARQAQASNDLIAKSRLKFIDADIARIESIIGLNNAKENAVGIESSLGQGGGGSSFGKALLGQAGKESNANLNALLGSAADDVGTVYDRANRYEMLGYEPGKDFGIIKGDTPNGVRSFFGAEATPDRIVFPRGSRLKGAAKGVQENAPAARITAPQERTGNPSPAFDDEKPAAVRPEIANGQTSGAIGGRTAEILRTYPTAKAIVAAQKSGAITLEEGSRALDALGVARRPRT